MKKYSQSYQIFPEKWASQNVAQYFGDLPWKEQKKPQRPVSRAMHINLLIYLTVVLIVQAIDHAI